MEEFQELKTQIRVVAPAPAAGRDTARDKKKPAG
jgi:hypothetical protein